MLFHFALLHPILSLPNNSLDLCSVLSYFDSRSQDKPTNADTGDAKVSHLYVQWLSHPSCPLQELPPCYSLTGTLSCVCSAFALGVLGYQRLNTPRGNPHNQRMDVRGSPWFSLNPDVHFSHFLRQSSARRRPGYKQQEFSNMIFIDFSPFPV